MNALQESAAFWVRDRHQHWRKDCPAACWIAVKPQMLSTYEVKHGWCLVYVFRENVQVWHLDAEAKRIIPQVIEFQLVGRASFF
jgi:hypothetical protein